MSQIVGEIQPQAFELVRDRIGAILADELDYQASRYNPHLDADVFVERFTPVSYEECPVVNVTMNKGGRYAVSSQYSGHTALQEDGEYRYFIEAYVGAEAQEGSAEDKSKRGDVLAMIRCQRLMGVIRAILMHPKYIRLGFGKGDNALVMSRRSEELEFGDSGNPDNEYLVFGRLSLLVRLPEVTNAIGTNAFTGFDTRAKLYLTDKGYKFNI